MISFQQFFEEKFEFDLHANLMWSRHFTEHEAKLSPYMIRSMSHIINVYHLWASRLAFKKAESGEWDILPVDFMEKFHKANYQDIISFLEHHSLSEKINYHDSEGVPMEKETLDILYHILHHSTYHRAQIAKECRDLGLPVVSANFIVFR